MSAPLACSLPTNPRFLVGIDGGGTGTRARLQSAAGVTLGWGSAGPSGLSQGVEQAWRHVGQAITLAFEAAGLAPAPVHEIGLGLGLAGACVTALRRAFIAADPGYALCVLDSDAISLLLGSHGGQPGLVVAAGTGSVGAVRTPAGQMRICGGWGFAIGDEGSGAWLGKQAVQHLSQVLDGRVRGGALSAALTASIGADKPGVQAWCASAGQHAHAQLAPRVFVAAEQGDPFAQGLLQRAAHELARLASALDPAEVLPVAVGGSVGERLWPLWPAALRARRVPACGDSADGALQLLRLALSGAGRLDGREAAL